MWIYGQGFPLPEPEPSKPANTEAYEREADPADLILCRPCRDAAHIQPLHDCDGEGCQCLMCALIRPTVEEMQLDWERHDREDSWPK